MGDCVQERSFSYDNRGFLLSEQHLEIGPAGNGVSLYTYDGSGNVLSKFIAGSSDFSLRYRYDPANRLVGIDEVVDPSPLEVRPLKEFHYARSNAGPDLRAGKLVMSKRTNWVDPIIPLFGGEGSIPIAITQSYRYEGRDGRISARQTRATVGVGHYAFLTEFEWTRQGNLDLLRYPRCLHGGCVGDDPPRQVDFSYVRGALTSVSGYAPSLSYQLGGMLHQVEHANGVTETIATKPGFPMQRPHQITTTGVAGGNNWSSGTYLYDGAGNVKRIGSQRYQYDRMSRLLAGEVLVGAQEKTQSLAYDAFGNILSLTTDGSFQSTPTSNATNRLTGVGAGYDAGGNLTDITLSGESYEYTYDPLNMMKYLQSDTGQARGFLYDADDERIMTFDCAFVDGDCAVPAQLTTTIRGLDGKVLRIYNQPFGGAWNWERDYVYRDGQLLASVEPNTEGGEDTVHFHLDHLGSPRQITDELGVQAAFHSYYPFGGEATDPSQDDVELKFTGHERDDNGGAGAGALDYMHARHFSPRLGRFLSTDPERSIKLPLPQTWNRYSYTSNRPMSFIDTDGRETRMAIMFEADARALLAGEISPEEFRARNASRAKGALVAASFYIPGPEDLVFLGLAAKASVRTSLGARIGGFFKSLFGKSKAATTVTRVSSEALGRLSPQARKAVQSLEKRIVEHRAKLESFRNNPDAFDNKGFLANAPSQEIRDDIIQGRIRHLEREIGNFEKQIKMYLEALE